MSFYNDNLAYDWELFEEKKEQPPAPKAKEEQQPQRARNGLRLFKILAVFAVCGFLAGALIYANAMLAEFKNESIVLDKQYAALKDEETRLNVELDSRVCMKDIDEYITDELGMVKLEKYQVNYIDLSQGDTMAVTQEEEGLFQKIGELFDGIRAYFR